MDSLCGPLLFPWIQVISFNSLLLNELVKALKILFNNSKPFSCFHTMLCDGGILVVYDEDASTDSQGGIN